MKLLGTIIGIVCGLALSASGQSRYVTLVLNNLDVEGPVVLSQTLTISSNEVVVSKAVYGNSAVCDVVAQGVRLATSMQANSLVLPLAGPAEIRYWINSYQGGNIEKAYMTFEIVPGPYAPNRSAVISERDGPMKCTLEESTDLVNWTQSTSGQTHTLTNANAMKFFRVKLEREVGP